ncbi:MAG: iron-sulfur protein, partial [Ilumatobacteraceae bacterium]
MSTHPPASAPPEQGAPKRLKPHQLVIAIGVFIGVFTLLSGVLPQFTKWHATKKVSREVFGGIPGAIQVAFYTVIPALLIWGSFAFADRVR